MKPVIEVSGRKPGGNFGFRTGKPLSAAAKNGGLWGNGFAAADTDAGRYVPWILRRRKSR